MPPKRELDIGRIKELRGNGATWQEIAVVLGWNVSALRARLRNDGYFATEYREKYLSAKKAQFKDDLDGVPIDWNAAEKMFMAGCDAKDVAASFGVNETYFAERYAKSKQAVHPSLDFWIEQCRAQGRCALKLAQYEHLLKRRLIDNG